jgi:hypothetical protein
LSILFVKRLLVEKAVRVDTTSIQGIADRVAELPARGQYEDSSGIHVPVLDSPSNDLGDALGFLFDGAPLEDEHFAFGVSRQRRENARSPARIVVDQRVRQLDHQAGTAATIVESLVMGAGVALVKRGNAFRVGELEGIDGLVLVPDHDEMPPFGEQVEENLLGPIEVLILVDENVLEHAAVGRGGIFAQVAQGFWDELPNEHGLVKSEPANEFPVKIPVHGILRPAGRLGLEACPSRVERLQTAVALADSSKAIAVQVLEQKSLLEMQERTRDPAGGFENFGVA